MANWSNPVLTSTYTNFVTEVKARDEDLARGLDPATTAPTNVPTNAIRWSSAASKWQKWNGTAWGDLSATYAISITGNAATATTATTATTAGSATTATTATNVSGGTASVTSVTTSGGLAFTGSANRITGDFSNSSIASRVLFQTTTTNSLTAVEAVPNGAVAAGTNSAAFNVNENSDPTNGALGQMAVLKSTEVRISSNARGTGSVLPMTFWVGSEQLRIDTSGNLLASATATGHWQIPRGTTAQRTGSPGVGMLRYNTTLNQFEGYNGTGWGKVGGGATGGGSDDVFHENGQTVNSNYTLTSGKNAVSAGPISIASGITVTVPAGSNWAIV